MSITECPHGHRHVVPSDSGDCPSCAKNVAAAPAGVNLMRLLVVRCGESFPSVCFNCAQPVRRTIKVQVSNVDAATSLGRGLLGRLIPFGGFISAFDAAKRDIFLMLKLPICDNCRKRRMKPEIQSYDLESREMRLVVCEQFRDVVRRE